MINTSDLKPKKILLLRMDRIGDMFCTTPALRAFRHAYPEARIDLVASPGNRDVVADNPHIDTLLTFPLKQYWLWPLFFLRVRRQGYDMAVALNGISTTMARLARFSGAPLVAGTWARKTEGYFDLTVRHQPGDHTIDLQLRLAAALGAPSADRSMVFPVAEALLERARARYPLKGRRRRVALFIGNARKVDTRWPEGCFAELAQRLAARGDVEVQVVAGPGDEGLLGGFSWSEGCRLYPGGSLAELAAFLKTCDLLVTSSSGPMHLAAAVDVPMVAILADYTFECWRPLASIHRIVQSGEPGVRVTGVTVHQVAEAVDAMLDGRA